jgi:hypothetical protein
MDWRAHKHPDRLKIKWTLDEDPHDSHHEKAQAEVGPQGVDWTDLVSAHSGLPHGASWLVPHSTPGVFAAIPRWCSGL